MTLDDNWFTEICQDSGSAFSLELGENKKLCEEKTPFQTIEIYETTKFGRLMTIDGFVMLTSRDNFIYHEMMSHPALFTHPNPQRVLIIGGGDCGTLREVLKHPEVKLAQQVDIDERVTRLSEQYFPELCESNNDPRAELHFVDGIKWVKDAEAGYYDIIIVDSTDPIGPGEVLFTQEFYNNSHRALNKGGMIVQQSESPLYHINEIIKPMYNKLNTANFADIQTLHFPQCVYPSGWWTCTIACKDGHIPQFRQQAVENKSFITHYYNEDIHQAASATPEFMKQALSNNK